MGLDVLDRLEDAFSVVPKDKFIDWIYNLQVLPDASDSGASCGPMRDSICAALVDWASYVFQNVWPSMVASREARSSASHSTLARCVTRAVWHGAFLTAVAACRHRIRPTCTDPVTSPTPTLPWRCCSRSVMTCRA